jgi:hypothetical protein
MFSELELKTQQATIDYHSEPDILQDYFESIKVVYKPKDVLEEACGKAVAGKFYHDGTIAIAVELSDVARCEVLIHEYMHAAKWKLLRDADGEHADTDAFFAYPSEVCREDEI